MGQISNLENDFYEAILAHTVELEQGLNGHCTGQITRK